MQEQIRDKAMQILKSNAQNRHVYELSIHYFFYDGTVLRREDCEYKKETRKGYCSKTEVNL